MKNKPIQFIAIFAISYIGLNLLYQGFLYLYAPLPDLFTVWVTKATLYFLPELHSRELVGTAGLQICEMNKPVVNVKEACNGIAVWISLLSFIIAFRSKIKLYLIFIPISFLVIQICNVLRLYILIRIRIQSPQYFDFFHVYAFPAIIYFIAFLLMIVWVKMGELKSENRRIEK